MKDDKAKLNSFAFDANSMMLGLKDTIRIVSHFMLPQSCKTFEIREAPAPLLPHVLAGSKVIHPLSCKHDVASDLLTLVSYHELSDK